MQRGIILQRNNPHPINIIYNSTLMNIMEGNYLTTVTAFTTTIAGLNSQEFKIIQHHSNFFYELFQIAFPNDINPVDQIFH